MSVSKVKHQHKIILDFSDQKLSKTTVKQSLREVDIEPLFKDVSDKTISEQMVCIENEIKVGMYKISIVLPPAVHRFTHRKLKEFGNFQIQIFETGKTYRDINLRKDNRFKEQYWVQKNNYGLKVNDLTDIICYCKRLDQLKCFL